MAVWGLNTPTPITMLLCGLYFARHVRHFAIHFSRTMMPKDSSAQDYERILTASLTRAIDFIKFAEAKNAALLTFASAWALAITAITANNHSLSDVDLTTLAVGRGLFIIVILLVTWSFLPKLRPERFHRNAEKPKNLLFYGDIASFEFDTFATKLRQAYRADSDVVGGDRYLDDLAAQIWINSRIAVRKYKAFHAAAVMAFLGVIAAAAPALMAGLHWLGSRLPGTLV